MGLGVWVRPWERIWVNLLGVNLFENILRQSGLFCTAETKHASRITSNLRVSVRTLQEYRKGLYKVRDSAGALHAKLLLHGINPSSERLIKNSPKMQKRLYPTAELNCFTLPSHRLLNHLNLEMCIEEGFRPRILAGNLARI